MTDLKEVYDSLLTFMRVGYREFDIIPFDMIDSFVDLVVTIEIRFDSEFKQALGEGYYR